jgi:hypothetical protein
MEKGYAMSAKTAEFEPTSGVVRIFSEGRSFGQPYDWVASVRWLSPTSVEILGIEKAPKPSEWRALIACWKKLGVETMVFSRYKSQGTTIKHVIKIR